MPIVSFACAKGGTGKTTTTVIVAGEIIASNSSVTVIDADPRHPITEWATMKPLPEGFNIIESRGERHILDEIDEAARKTAFVLVDLEGAASKMASFAMAASDLVVIPTQEQQQDANAAIETLRELRQAGRVGRRTIPASILLTRTKAAVKSRTARHINDQLRSLDTVTVFTPELVERDAYAAMFAIGGTLRDLSPKDVNGIPKAIENASAICNAMVELLRTTREQK